MYKVLRSTKSAVRFSLKHSKKYLLENRYQEIFKWRELTELEVSKLQMLQ